MNKNKLILLMIMAIFFMNCAGRKAITTNYYILQYFQHSENKDIYQQKSFDFSAIVYDAKISNTYDRKKIVIRHFGPKITYSNRDLWGTNLSDGIADLVAKRISSYNIFNQVQRTFWDVRPDYEINSIINNIEYIRSDNINEVHINMDIILTHSGEEVFLVKHSVSREERLFTESMESFVQKANDIILEETDKFSVSIQNYFNGVKPPEKGELESKKIVEIDSLVEISGKMGKLIFPAISKTDNEPQYKIINENDEAIFAQPGAEIALESGQYELMYGSGSPLQKMNKRDITIHPMYSTEIEPDWACMIVDVLDERRNYRQVRYEIFDMEDGESFGTHYPVKKELGEQQKVWMLKPGLYKITINNEPFNTYLDFTTIYLQKGKLEKLSLIVGVDDDDNPTNLIGAGVMEDQSSDMVTEHWRLSNAIHGNFNMNSNNDVDKDEYATTTVVTSQLENRVVYNNMPHYYYMRNLVELGFTKSSDVDLRLSVDDFDLKNTYVLFMLKNFGIYGRFDLNTHLFPSFKYYTTKMNYIKQDKNEKEIERNHNETEIKLTNGGFPLVMKEGIGFNYRIFNTPRAKLNFRTGLGIRQDFSSDVFTLANNNYIENEISYYLFREMEDVVNTGTEISLVGNFNLPFNLSYMTNADILFPFDGNEDITVDWENVFNLRIMKYISIYYKLNLQNKNLENSDDYILSRHSLFVRLTYFFR